MSSRQFTGWRAAYILDAEDRTQAELEQAVEGKMAARRRR